MRKLALLAAAASVVAIPSAANATVTLINGNNQLTAQIHLDASANNSNVQTVHGITSSGLQVLFTGNTNIDGTSGSGYAQITDNLSNSGVFNTLTITPGNFTGFTAFEFSIDYNGSHSNPIYLTIGYTLLGGGTGSFVFDPTAANHTPLNNLQFTNNANRDFQLDATGGSVLTSIILSGRYANGSLAPIFEEKQNDVVGVIITPPRPSVPEPATWAMMLAGFGATGFAMRRTRRKNLLAQIA